MNETKLVAVEARFDESQTSAVHYVNPALVVRVSPRVDQLGNFRGTVIQLVGDENSLLADDKPENIVGQLGLLSS